MNKKNLGLSSFTNLIFALLFIIGLMTFSYFKSNRSSKWVAHTLAVKNDIQFILSDFQNAEIGQRGYLITLEEPYLAPYMEAVGNYNGHSKLLKKEIKDNNSQLERLEKVDSLAQLKFRELENIIQMAKSGQMEEDLKLVQKKIGKPYMDQIRMLLDDMVLEEDLLLESRKKNFLFWRNLIAFLIATALITILYSLYNLYKKVRPLFEDLLETKVSLEKANVNISESLYNLKKANQEKDLQTTEKEKALKYNEHLVEELRTQKEKLDHFTHIAASELKGSLNSIVQDLDSLDNEEDKGYQEKGIRTVSIKSSLERMRALIDLLGA